MACLICGGTYHNDQNCPDKLYKIRSQEQWNKHLDDLRKLEKRMEAIGNDSQWSDLDEGYKQASRDWAFEVKKLLRGK